ncbi:MAG TPA: SDR family oxidoreductase [Gaiellaceae bacterium]|jgi:nucleoside-diphosphate-sugar epimerase
MPRALILGGTGAIGRATAWRLLTSGWEVEVTGRDPAHLPRPLAAAGVRFSSDPTPGAELIVDCICFTAADAARLVELARDAESTVMVSSKAVYVDDAGNHTNSPVKPRFDGAIKETQPTMAPSFGDYTTAEGYGGNKVAAEQVLLDSGLPVTVLRPSKIHGAGSRQPREWVFVKRVLERRSAVFLARRGESVDHPTAAANIAALVELAARTPGARILNAADPDAPNAREIARTVAERMGHAWSEVLLDDDGPLGRHPWQTPHPIVLDTTAALDLGYTPAGTYEETVADEIDWLVEAASGGDDASLVPRDDDEYFSRFFNDAAEDLYLKLRS